MFLLDTNVVSELRAGKPAPAGQVLAWAADTRISSHYLSSVSIFELELGILKLERRGQGASLRAWLEGVRRVFQGRVLPFSDEAAILCARMHVPNSKSFRDAMIAAIALEHGFTLVTRNVRDFRESGARLLDPWEA